MYDRIVAALDGSELAEQVLPHVEALAERFGATLILLRVTPAPDAAFAAVAPVAEVPGRAAITDPVVTLDAERREADRYLTGLYDRLTAKGLRIHYQRPEGPPAELIVEHARMLDADLIALTTHGRSGLQRLVFGSVAEAVIRSAPCPVLVVRVEAQR